MSNPFDLADDPDANPFDTAGNELERQRLGRAQDSVRSALELDPKTLGRAGELAQRTGLPVDTVSRNLDTLERQQRFDEIPWDEVGQSPALTEFLSDPNRAAVVAPDLRAVLDLRKALGGNPAAPPQPQTVATAGPVAGMLEPGNIDLSKRPRVRNADGSVSTVRSISVGMDGVEYLIPTVDGDRVLSDDEAIALFRETGKHLGVFDTPDNATQYALALHEQQAKTLDEPRPSVPGPPDPGLLSVLANRFESGRRTAFEIPAAAQPLILAGLGLRSAPTFDELRTWDELRKRPLGPTQRAGALDDILGAPLEQVPVIGKIAGAAALGGAAGAGLGALAGSALPGPGTIAGAGTGFALGAKAGSAYSVFWVEAGNAFSEFQGLADEQGQPLPANVVAAGAATVGAINSGLELIGFGAVASRIPGLRALVGKGRAAVSATVAKRMANPTTRAALLAGAREVMAAVGVEVGTEVAQEAVNVETGRELSGQGLGLTGEEVGRLGETAAQTALGVLPLAGVGQVVSVTMDRIATAQQNAAQLDAARQAVAAAQSRELSPQAFGDLTEALAREAGVEDVGIPAHQLLELYEGAGGTVEDLVADVPEATAQLQEALATGGDLRVPVGRYFGPLEERFGDALTEHVRLRPEDLTVREATESETVLDSTVERAMAREAAAAGDPIALKVAEAQDGLGLEQPLFVDPASSGLTEDEFSRYAEAVQAARAKATEQVQREAKAAADRMKGARDAENRTMARIRAQFEKEAAAEVDADPVHQARAFLSLRVEGQEAQRLDRDRIASLYGDIWLDKIPKGLVQKNGLHPDSVAELFGYENGLELVSALAIAPTREQSIADLVESKTIQRFGNFFEDGRLEAAASEAAQNDEQIRVLQIEERALARLQQPGGPRGQPTPRALVRAAAERLIAAKRVKDVRADAYRQQAQTAARNAIEAVAERDYEGASYQKRAQILNLALEQEARRVEKETVQAKDYFASFSTKAARERIGKAGGEFLAQIDGLLERFGIRPGAADPERSSLGDWATAQEAAGEETTISDRLRREQYRLPWRELPVGELRELREALENIEELARRQLQITVKAETAQLESVEARIVAEIETAFTPARGVDRGTARLTKTALEQGKSLARSVDASLSKVEFLIDALSGGDPGSMLRRFIWEPLVDAQAAYNRRVEEYAKKFQALRTGVLGDENVRAYQQEIAESRLKDTDGRALRLTKWNVLMIASNMGNASNMAKLLGGFGWDQKTVEAVLDAHMTATDWKFVQGVWDLFETLWPDIAAQSKRMTGVAPPKIQAQPIATRHGTFTGGYFPVAYDYERSALGQRMEGKDMLPGAAEGFTRPTVGHGFTNARTKVEAPLRIDPNVIPNHVDQVLLYLTHAEPIRDAARVLSRKGVDGAITKALGAEFNFGRFWTPWLQGIARDTADPGPLAAWNRVARWTRLRGTVFKLAFRETTLVAQASGLFNGLRTLQTHLPSGAKGYLLDGAWRAFGSGNPLTIARRFQEVRAKSDFMKDRVGTMNRDLRDIVRDASRTQKITDQTMAFAMELIARVQIHMVDMPVWLAAHRAATESMGQTEEQAVRFADSMVRMSQGGGTKLDQSAFERGDRGGEFLKSMTLFYSYNNLVYNQLRASGRALRSVSDFPSFLASFLLYVTLPGLYSAVAYALVKGKMPDPDKDDYDAEMLKRIADAAVGGAATSVPFLRDAWSSSLSGRVQTATAAEVFIKEALDLERVKDGTDLLFDVLRTGALYGGLPGSDRVLRGVEGLVRDED